MRCGRPRRPMGSTTRPISPRCRSGSATRTSPPRGSTIPAHAAGGQSDLQGGVLRDGGPAVAQAWGFPLVGSGRAYNGGQLRSAISGFPDDDCLAVGGIVEINLIALVNDAMRRKEVIVRPIPRNDRLGTAPQGGEFLLPSGLMAAGHDDRIIGSDVSSSFVSLAHVGYTQATVLYDYVEVLCHAAGTAMDRLLRAQYSVADVAAFFWDRDGMVITLWYLTAPVSLRPDVISDAGARLRPDWRLLDFDSDAVTGGEKCRDSQKNKSAPSSEWPPA
jgi:hypothetical protein